MVEQLIREVKTRDAYFNVNIPYCAPEDVTGIRVVPFQRFARSPMAYYPSDNAGKFFISIPETPTPLDPEHDFRLAVRGNAITVTPLMLQHTDYELAGRLDGTLGL